MIALTPLQKLLSTYRKAAKTEREKGTYFEELARTYFRHEPTYADLFSDVWLLNEIPDEYGIEKKDTGIDLVAKAHGTGELHAIQCKCYEEDEQIKKSDIDSFFTASGKKQFTHRIIVTTTNNWSDNAEEALFNQSPPVTRIDLHDLEASQIKWEKYEPESAPELKPKFDPRPHQETAIKRALEGLGKADRGKLIMACGTGKTFTSLKIAEKLAGKGKRVLFLVPSLALLSQTLTEWTQQSRVPLHSFAVCSDSHVGKKRKKSDIDADIVQTFTHELQYPATTNADRLAEKIKLRHDDDHMSAVFSTYHSIEVIHEAQHGHGLADFDLIVCDEAHRTTGATFDSETESAFVRVHDAEFIRASKRLYMTATPRIYADSAKAKAIQESITICSMDDEELYGKQLHVITFSEAVDLGLLTDYKVVVLAVDAEHADKRLQSLWKDENNQLKVDDAARIIGCWKALSKQGLSEELSGDITPMQKAVAFCQVIEPSTGKKTHKVSSKQIADMFQRVIDAYQEDSDDADSLLKCESKHVDGSMNASQKESKINWLKEETTSETCRILSNVRCLSEGVDVPALDAVLFLSPRSSQVEVVQSVGRVMRKAPGKKLGYVILPVVIPHGMKPHEALADNKVYKVVWEVLQALRSHDDRFDSFINKMDLMSDPSGKMEVVAVTENLAPKSKTKRKKDGKGGFDIGVAEGKADFQKQTKLQFDVGELERALYAKLVKKCGNRSYWEEWANDIAEIAQTHIGRITTIVEDPKNKKEIKAFKAFADELRDDLNDAISDGEVIEMLAQHLITQPVFDALFEDYKFATNNPVSKGMQTILDLLDQHRLENEADTLTQFYESVKRRAAGIDNAEGKQKIVVELYDKFFRNAFPKMTERLGIVYTPVEVVDFIIHSVNDILQEEFGQTLGSEGVHILDPFVGTGTFITRLMQSGLITPEQLPHKYKKEIHCNEIVLLAYYIAAINIEAVYHSIMSDKAEADSGEAPAYEPFDGICLTDTFQMYESDDLIEQFFPDNSERRKRQKKLDIRVIMANPPYSVGQKSANDANQNVGYSALDERIGQTYAVGTSAVLKNSLYDSYIRAIRWASDRVADCGVIGFVINAGFVDSTSGNGLRKCLAKEFSQVYVLHLRGNQRTSGELSRKEGGKVFGSGSRAPIAILFLVKKPNKEGDAEILFHDIGDYLSREQKLEKVREFSSVNNPADNATQIEWTRISPDAHGDWINQRDESFSTFIAMGGRGLSDSERIFKTQSGGIKSNRDAWAFNSSRADLESHVKVSIDFYNQELKRVSPLIDSDSDWETNNDSSKISWTRGLRERLGRKNPIAFDEDAIRQAHYRPYSRQWVYLDSSLIEVMSKVPTFFPEGEQNVILWVTGIGATVPFSCWITSSICGLQQGPAAVQHFPLYSYDSPDDESDLFAKDSNDARRYSLTTSSADHFIEAYSTDSITKEDLF